ncbi:MAG: glutathione binding-like protein [Litorimonas sp.]
MLLYYTSGACSLGPHIALKWSGADYKTKSMPFGDKSLETISNSARVPILDLEDGSLPLTQSPAIQKYLIRNYPDADIGGDASDESEIDRWLSFLASDLHPPFHSVFVPNRYTDAKDSLSHKQVRSAGEKLIRAELTRLENQLEGREYIVGNRKTVVDAYAFPMLRWSIEKLSNGLDDYPNVMGLHNRIQADPAVQDVMKEEGLI